MFTSQGRPTLLHDGMEEAAPRRRAAAARWRLNNPPAMGWECLWRTTVQGLKTQCIGLAGPLEGDVSQAACEAQCCRSSVPGGAPVKDGRGHTGACDLWQWAPMADMKKKHPTQATNCYVGVRDHTDSYNCVGSTMARYDETPFIRGVGCAGLNSGFGGTFVLIMLVVGAAYFGGGYAYKRRISGARGWRALPHAPLWMELAALVQDGLDFTRRGRQRGGGGGGGRGEGYARMGEPSKSSGKDKKGPGGKEKGSKKSRGGTSKKGTPSGGAQPPVSAGEGGSGARSPAEPAKEWTPTVTGHLAAGARETGVKVQMS